MLEIFSKREAIFSYFLIIYRCLLYIIDSTTPLYLFCTALCGPDTILAYGAESHVVQDGRGKRAMPWRQY